MVSVVIDGPLREKNIGALIGDNFPEIVEMHGVQDGMAIDLFSEDRARLEYSGGPGGFSHSHFCGCAALFFRPLAIVQMEKNNFVAQCGEACDGAAATIFGVAGMSSRNDHFESFSPRIGTLAGGSIRA